MANPIPTPGSSTGGVPAGSLPAGGKPVSGSQASRATVASSDNPTHHPEPSEDFVLTKVGAPADPSVDNLLSSGPVATGPTVANPTVKVEKRSEPSTPALAEDAKAQNLSTLKDFRLIKKLGEGGMGAVYKAHQISLDRVVAVKVPFKHLAKDGSFVQRFYREARVMAKLDHPNILRVYGVGEENSWHYLAMEYIDGLSMQHWLNKLGKLSVGDALHIAMACGHGLQHAHDQGMVHRDIKPDNILVTNKGIVKVADMGLAKALEDDLSLSRTGTGAGTPHYMAPEQARDAKHVDHRCDIYALGSMLHCFLSGKPPFQGDTYVDLLVNKDKGQYVPARRTNPEVPDKLDLIIGKAVQAKPELRYKSCNELIKDLEGLGLANEALSFIPGAIRSPVVRASTAAAPAGPARPGAPAGTGQKITAASKAAGADWWYVAMESPDGKMVKRKMNTLAINGLIRDKKIELETQVSRNLKGPFRNIAYYKEFQTALQGRVSAAKAQKQAAQFKNKYQDIMRQEKSWKFRKKVRELFRNVTGWITFLMLLAAIGGAGFAVYYFFGEKIMSFLK